MVWERSLACRSLKTVCVLILVCVEDGVGGLGEGNKGGVHPVLILVCVEDGVGAPVIGTIYIGKHAVLILVCVEDGVGG